MNLKNYLLEYVSSGRGRKEPTIVATDDTIHQIVKDELDRLGHDADLNHIDVSKVTNMDSLFSCSFEDLGQTYKDLNPDISGWDVSNVESMKFMFYNCINFNQDISQWDIGKVKDIQYMFYNCKNFIQDLSGWDVSKVVSMYSMFNNCENFNQDLSGWDVSKVLDMRCMFWNCENFIQDLSSWNVRNVKYHNDMFNGCPIKEEYKPKFKK